MSDVSHTPRRGPVKRSSSRRLVSVSGEVIEVLRAHAARQPADCICRYGLVDFRQVCADVDGRLVTRRMLQLAFRNLLPDSDPGAAESFGRLIRGRERPLDA